MNIKPTSYVGTSEEYAATAVALKKMVTAPPEFPRQVSQFIWEISKGEFTFIDETDNYYELTYATVEAAQAALKMYGDEL